MARIYICPRGHHKIHHGKSAGDAAAELSCALCGARGAYVRVPPGYEVFTELGRGGMGVVFKACHEPTSRMMALKIINPFVHGVADNFERFVNEAAAVTNIDHPNIVRIFDVGQSEGLPYFSLEFIDGGSLADQLAERGKLGFREAAELVETLARAIHAAHERGILHRDLKPANILMTKENQPKIADFGLAKFLNETQDLTRTGIIMGTPSYMSPEQARGEMKEAGPAADIYSLGVILYHCVTGNVPLRGENEFETLQMVVYQEAQPASSVNAETPLDLDAICMKCLEKRIDDRYNTAEELANDLRRFLVGAPVQAVYNPPARVDLNSPLARSLANEVTMTMEAVIPEVFGKPVDPAALLLAEEDAAAKLDKASRVAFLKGLSRNQLDTLSRCGSYHNLAPGEVIFLEGDRAMGLYIVLSGEVLIYNSSPQGREMSIARIGPDEVFGEMGLVIEEGTRTASARALDGASLFELPGNPVKLIKLFSDPATTMTLLQNLICMLRRRLQQRDRARLDLLREYVPGVADPTLAQKAALKVVRESLPRGMFKNYSVTRRLRAGEILFREGDDPDGFHFIQTGELEIIKESGAERPHIIGRVAAPNIVGEVGFFSGEKRTATVRAADAVVLTHFSGADFHKLTRKDPDAALNVMLAAAQLAVHLIVQRHLM